MKELPIGIQSISEIVNRNCVYADKTDFAQQLMKEGKYYFMSRPRRFGKSLFLNTLQEIFKGNKKLFKGCKIYNSQYTWEKHPVLLLDFSQILNTTTEQFETALQEALHDVAEFYGISITGSSSQSLLKRLVIALAKKNQVVALIDEYDQPIINNLKNPEVAEKNRDLLKNFFGTLKSLDIYVKFTFVTGVSKFSQVSLFSGPNNLKDITMDPRYADMMGYTEKELRLCFLEHVQAIVKKRHRLGKEEEIFKEVQKWYNGYRFSEKEITVYNPFSTLLFLDTGKAESYWYRTGTPSFLIEQIKKHPQSIVPLAGATASKAQLLDISDIEQVDLKALMFQTGYLTICGHTPMTNRYSLDFPNQEVKNAFLDSLIHQFAPITPTLSDECQEALDHHNLPLFVDQMRMMFSSFPYQLFTRASEHTYQGLLLGILKGMGFEVEGEKEMNLGRIDLVLKTLKTIYLFEFKLDSTADIALKQIYQKKYSHPYRKQGKQIAIVGMNFSSKLHNISDWKGELLSEAGEHVHMLHA